MPVTILITPQEADAARVANVGEVDGSIFTYDPNETMAHISKITETGHDGSERLSGRLATIYGQMIVKRSKEIEAEAPLPSPTIDPPETVVPRKRSR